MKYTTCLFFTLIFLGCFSPPRPIDQTINPKSSQLVDLGVEKLRSGDLNSAEALFTAAYEIAPNAPALDGLGCVAYKQNEFTKAKAYFVQSQARDSHYVAAVHHEALVLDRMGLVKEAESSYEKAMHMDAGRATLRNDYAAFIFDAHSKESESSAIQSYRLWLQAKALHDPGLAELNIKKLFEDKEFDG